MAATSIEWTDVSWNPARGCSLVSAGCTNCYAMKQAHRHDYPGGHYEGLTKKREKGGPVWTGEARFIAEKLGEPLRWGKPRRVFVNSMSDLFHEGLSFEQIAAVFGVMAATPQHTYQILTKRPEHARAFFEWLAASPVSAHTFGSHRGARWWAVTAGAAVQVAYSAERPPSWPWPLPNVWLGVSVEDQATADERIPILLGLPAALRWISYEPALGPIDFTRIAHRPEGDTNDPRALVINALRGYFDANAGEQRALSWVVVGGESGPGARPFDLAWARSTIAQCREAGVPCFVKQIGSRPEMWPVLDRKGGDLREWPEDLRVREFPEVPHVRP